MAKKPLQLLIFGAVLVTLFCGVTWVVNSERGKREAEEIAKAPHVSDDTLFSAYTKNSKTAQKKFDGKIIVVTGIDCGEDEGLFGDGCIHMENVVCDVGSHFDAAAVSHPVTVVGMCKGRDAYGNICISNARVLSQ